MRKVEYTEKKYCGALLFDCTFMKAHHFAMRSPDRGDCSDDGPFMLAKKCWLPKKFQLLVDKEMGLSKKDRFTSIECSEVNPQNITCHYYFFARLETSKYI